MPQKVRIALDAMGGDHGAPVVVAGAAISLERHPDTEFILVGDRTVVEPLLAPHPALSAASRIVHTDISVKMNEKPSQALRHGRWKSSMWMAIDAVKKGEADAVVSAGNTGALMAMARFHLKTMAGISRPAIAALVADAARRIDRAGCRGDDRGRCPASRRSRHHGRRHGTGAVRPRTADRRPAQYRCRGGQGARRGARSRPHPARGRTASDLDYVGFVEGDDIGKGTVDVVVTEGFSGNIALKTAEGTAKQLGEYLRNAMSRTLFAKLGYLLARNAFAALKDKMDPRKVNGGVFLGLNGVVIKSHGGTDAEGFAAAVDLGYDMARYELQAKISQTLGKKPSGVGESPVAESVPS